MCFEKRGGIMATKSFTSDTFVLDNNNASKFRNIMDCKEKVRIAKVKGHKTITSKKGITELLNLK